MLIEVALALEIQRTNPKLTEETAENYAAWVLESAKEHKLDPWLFHGLFFTESRWTAGVVRKEGNGSCSVGLGQINTTCWDEDTLPLRDPRENIRRTAAFLSKIRGWCRRQCEDLGWVRLYNPGASPLYLEKIVTMVRRCHARYSAESPHGAVHACLHDARLSWGLSHCPID